MSAQRPSDALIAAIPVRILILDVLMQLLTPTPVPARMLRAAIRERFGRNVTPAQVVAVISNEERAWGARAEPRFVAPAITDVTFERARGFVTLSTWMLEERVVPKRNEPEAFARAAAALSAAIVPPWSERANVAIRATVEATARWSLRRQIFVRGD